MDKGLMTEIVEDILLLDPNPEDIILQEVPIAGKTITTMEVTAGSPHLEVPSDLLPGGPELHLGHPVGIMTDDLAASNLVILLENVLRKTSLLLEHNLGHQHPPDTKTVLSCIVVNQKKKK